MNDSNNSNDHPLNQSLYTPCHALCCSLFYGYSLIFFSGYSAKFDKIENLIPVLANCFEESMSLFSTIPDVTGQSFKILSSIIQCLYSASEVLVQNSNMPKEHLRCSILVHLRKILEGFPFGLKNDLTDKVSLMSSLSVSLIHAHMNTVNFLR